MNNKKKIAAALAAALAISGMPVSAETLVGIGTDREVQKLKTEKETEKETETDRIQPNGWCVAVDPGHQGNWVDMSAQEPIGPGASETKAKATTGTTGRFSGLHEFELNLGVSLELRDELERRGYKVIMTREDNDKAISNRERAELAYEEGADILVRIHANGSDNESVSGALAMIPSRNNPYIAELYEECKELGTDILSSYCAATGFSNLDLQEYDNMSGINWSKIPVTILEMGFMTNQSDDYTMADEDFWPIMAAGIADGIDLYFEDQIPEIIEEESESESEIETEGESEAANQKVQTAMNALLDELVESISVKREADENWAAAVVDLGSGEMRVYNDTTMQAASLIKLFICADVYEKYEELAEYYGKDNIDGLLYDMITVSDNTAANTLTNYLGSGDDGAGREEVTRYCKENGYEHTVMGRMLLAPKNNGDNVTSVGDCAEFLKRVYNEEIPHAKDILNLLRQQERRHKIPAGLPEGVESGNKTGELDDVENDAAIIVGDRPYILCVMSENLTDVYNAQGDIADISSEVYLFIQQEL